VKFRLRRCAAGWLAATVVVSLLAVSQADSGTAEEAIRTAYTALQAALFKNDASAIASLLAPNFQARQVDGSIQDRNAYIKDQIEAAPGLTISSLTIGVTKVDVAGQTAQAEVQYAVTGTYAVQGVPKPLRGTMHATDQWALDAGRWKLLSSTVHEIVSYVDGKLAQDERAQLPELPPTSAAIAELRARAVNVPTLDLSADPQQLSAIGGAIGDARIVGMGEGSHGSTEFFAFKDRLFKYLVENKGFTVFAMEAAWGSGHVADRYINGGPGTARQAAARLGFWDWNTPEVADLLQWMRDYNARPGQHPMLNFAGVDMQDPMGAAGYLVEFLRAHDAAMARNAQAALACVADSVSAQYLELHRQTPIACRQKVSALTGQLASLKDMPDADVARDALTNVLQYLDAQAEPSTSAARDRDMAENAEWLAGKEFPRAKIALWAHNFHVSASVSPPADRPMGSYLRERFGADYYTIGQTFGSGTVRAIVMGGGLQSVAVLPKPGDSIAALFGPLNAIAFLDLRRLKSDSALHSYFSEKRSIEQIGGAVASAQGTDGRRQMLVLDAYDGLVYVPISTASAYATPPSRMKRDVSENGQPWVVVGPGFDDVSISEIAHGAALSNRDGLNGMPNQLLRRFDAAPYRGRTVRVSGQARRVNLLGFSFPFARVVSARGSVVAIAFGAAVNAQAADAWVPFVLKLSLPPNAQYIDAGVGSAGLGSAEVRNVTIGG
jgi:erythromycin esterase